MKIERLVAAKLWLEELEAQLAQLAVAKWKTLSEEFDGDEPPEDYEARAGEVDASGPIRAELASARALVEERALAVAGDRDAWPAGGSAVARACALADAKAQDADAGTVVAELLVLRGEMTSVRLSAGWVLGHGDFVAQVLACCGDPPGCDDEVERLVIAGHTIARSRAVVIERLARGAGRQ